MQLYLKEDIFLRNFAADLPAQTARSLWATQRPAAIAAFETRSAAAAWKKIPSWWVIGLKDQIIFPEVDYAKVDKLRGMNVTFVTSARTDEESQLLLKYLGMPFKSAQEGR